MTALSVAMAWLYWKTDGSLLLVMLMHAAVNNVRLVPAVVNEATPAFAFGGSLIGWLIVGVSWAVAAPMLIRMRGPASALESRPARAAKQSC